MTGPANKSTPESAPSANHHIGTGLSGSRRDLERMNRPTIFVSSTVEGMKTTRQVVREFLENSLGYHVLMSEYEGSKSKRPIAQCKKWAKDCDLFISILGDKYGWIIPELGISVSEMEFNEACKDNPEKILVYISAQRKEPRQQAFAGRIQDFSRGYYRRAPYKDDAELVTGIRDDMAEFFKERLDVLRSTRRKVRPSLTPSVSDYASYALKKRHDMMMADTIELSRELGFKPVIFIEPYFWLAVKHIKRLKVLFTIDVVPGNLKRDDLQRYVSSHQNNVAYTEEYKKHSNRFALTLVHGSATTRSLEWYTQYYGGTCCRVEPGLFYGEGLSVQRQQALGRFLENRLVLSGIRNHQDISVALSGAVEWLIREADRINFRRNLDKPLKARLSQG